jgi:RHS repeat-associated protein
VTDANSNTRTVVVENARGVVLSESRNGQRTTSYTYDPATGRPISATAPMGEMVEYRYDARGHIDLVRRKAAPGSGLADIVTEAGYEPGCANPVTCNQPLWTKDERGQVTTYTYNAAHGGVETVKRLRPQTPNPQPEPTVTYSYAAEQAVGRNASGVATVLLAPITVLTSVSTCASQSTCAGTADERKVSIGYGASGSGDNQLPISRTLEAGSDSATTTVTYDDRGNLVAVNGPLDDLANGVADITRYGYDWARQVVHAIGPDPDGTATTLKHRAQKATYNADGQVILAETGTTTSAIDIGTFAALTATRTTYDSIGRTWKEALETAGQTRALTQYAYDAGGRTICAAVRMNPAAFATTPASACTQGSAGSFGPDRITRVWYTVFDEPHQLLEGYGTAQQRTERTMWRDSRGQVTALYDARGNLTQYGYDGFGRPAWTMYPQPANGGAGSATDLEQFAYDAGSNLTWRRLRDGQVVEYFYDADSNLTHKALPGGAGNAWYGYNLLGEVTYAASATQTLGYGYDRLGRLTASSGPLGWMGQGYDKAGRRTRLTWPDGVFHTFDYDVTGAMTAIRENGGGAQVSMNYDDLGRRIWMGRSNAVQTAYGYDAAGRLSSLLQEMPGTGPDHLAGLTYNPAGQITLRTGNNALYDWLETDPSDSTKARRPKTGIDRAYTSNALNQHLTSGSTSFSYHARGVLTNDSGNGTAEQPPISYGYDAENRLTGTGGGAVFRYDPLGRLYESGTTAGVSRRFLYDGDEIAAEYDGSGALVARYVRGPGVDEPLLWYEGSGLGNRHWLSADERGSVVAVTGEAGQVQAVHQFDEYGIPAAAPYGRFGYTGQAWLPEAGLWHYKARAYSPTLGRFLQPDPIGTADGMNLYGYVGGDPVNAIDPSGNAGCTPDPNPEVINVCGRRPDRVPVHGIVELNFRVFRADGGGGSGGSDGVAGEGQQKSCPSKTSIAARVAYWADVTSVGSGAVAFGAGVAALATAPTVAGAVGFGSVAGAAALLSTAAGGVAVAAHVINGNAAGAALGAAGLAGGPVVGRLSTGAYRAHRGFYGLRPAQQTAVKAASVGTSAGIGAAAGFYSCE